MGVAGRLVTPLTILVALTLIAQLLAPSVTAYIPGIAMLREPYILLPSYMLPAVTKPGGVVDVSVRGADSVTVLEAYISGVRGSYKLILESSGKARVDVDPSYPVEVTRLTFRVPADTPDGLYTLVINSDKGLLWMPNSVIVDRSGGPRGVIRVAHLTDIHFGAEQGGYPNNFKHTRYIALLNTLVERLGVNLVVYTGDLIDVGTDVRSYRDFFSITSQVMVPQLAVTGNHDWAQVDRVSLLVDRFYGRYVVPLRVWSFPYGDFLFVGLDTRLEGYPEGWQLDYLEKVVSDNMDKAVVILMHHPLFTNAGEYKGNPEDLRGYVYRSWRELGWEQARRLLEIVERYKNIVAVLSGHVHRDADAIYIRSDGSKVYFITTTTANHGYPEYPERYYWGMKVLEISRDGVVRVITPPGRDYKPTAGSLNTENLLVFEVRDLYSTAVSWFFNTTRYTDFRELLYNATLVFYLNKTKPMESYRIYGDIRRVHSTKWYDLGLYYLAVIHANITGYGKLTIASYEDRDAPRISILSMTPREPTLGRLLVVNLQVTDSGWGVERVVALVKVNGVTKARVEAQRTLEPSQYRLAISVGEPGEYEIVIQAVDLNNNVGEERLKFNIPPPTPTEKPPETTTPTITVTPTQETRITPTIETRTEAPETRTTEVTGETRGFDWSLAVVVAAVIALILVAFIAIRRRS